MSEISLFQKKTNKQKERMQIMGKMKTFKKVVAAITTSALALVGTVTFNPADAKAEDTVTKTVHITVKDDVSGFKGVAVQAWCGVATKDTVAISTLSSCWGDDNTAAVTPVTIKDGACDLEITIDKADKDYGVYTGMQLIAYNEGADGTKLVNTGNAPEDVMAALNDAGSQFWMTFDIEAGTYSVTTTDPAAIKAADVEELIKAIGTVTLDSLSKIVAAETAVENYLKVSTSYKTSDISNYADLTAARATYDELKAADDKAKEEANAAAAGKLTLYVQAPEGWDAISIWAWTDAGNLFEKWPGKAMTACDNNAGWFKATIETDGVTNIIFNNAAEGADATAQTVDITDVAAGTYWYTLALGEEDKFNGTAVTEAPEGWEDEEEVTLETEDPTEDGEDEEGEDGEDGEGEEEEEASSWADATLKVHVRMVEGVDEWTKLGAYLFGTGESFGWSGGSGELTGAWPGTEMQLEIGSETWYAFGGTFDDGFYDLIINNFVSDDEEAEGATKLQAKEVEITDGEYWITIAADEEGNYMATVVTEAPEDYDGQGLEDDQISEAPDTEEEENGEDDSTTDNADPAKGNTGDTVPVAAAMMLTIACGAVVVASRKRKAA